MRVFTILIISSLISCSQSLEQRSSDRKSSSASLVDYDGFLDKVQEVKSDRESRIVTLDHFQQLSKKPNTIILDTRSKSSFDQIHMKNAVHLNFSDFTEDKLAKVIPNKETTILIYCNNNIESDLASLTNKSVELALNIPTFINLKGYGYENVFELGEYIAEKDHPELFQKGE